MTLVRNQDDVMRVIMEEFYYGCKIKNDAVAENDGICLKYVPVWALSLIHIDVYKRQLLQYFPICV